MQRNAGYVIAFAAAVCVVCAVIVSTAAVVLKERQDSNANAYRQANVLTAAGLLATGEKIDADELERRFSTIQAVVIDLRSGEEMSDTDSATFDQRRQSIDPSTSFLAPDNAARVMRLPDNALIYQMLKPDGSLDVLILPVEGKGLWSTLYGFVALESDLRTIRGITFYDQKETAGLGGEVDNPRWKALWPGRQAFDDSGQIAISVAKGPAGPVADDPHRVDGLSGATITSRGVTNLLHFWLGDHGFAPLLDRLREAS